MPVASIMVALAKKMSLAFMLELHRLRMADIYMEPESTKSGIILSAGLGDWVVFRLGDARHVKINGVDCRLVEDTRCST
jgi:hypothetical protein